MNSAGCIIRVPLLACLLALGAAGNNAAGDALRDEFITPPPAARPWVFWFTLNGNSTKEGITADLEAMARVGIGGVISMEVDKGMPKGSVDYGGPAWMDLIGHTCREAKRLGLEVNLTNASGWDGSAGPWITPELAMQKVVWTETTVESGTTAPIVLPQPKAERDYYRDIAVLAMPLPSVDFRIDNAVQKTLSQGAKGGNEGNNVSLPPLPATFPSPPEGSVISRDQILDLTAHMDQSGTLTWTPPPGKWLVMRFGHTTTGRENEPAPLAGRGLECDKLSKAAITFHFSQLMGKVIAQNRELTGQGKALVGVHVDSWECGEQNWTPAMREEFRSRRGYDLIPLLPLFSGRVIDSMETSERALWDLRETISELMLENYAGTLQTLAHQNGLRFTCEAYDAFSDNMAYAGRTDEPMGEFWAGYARHYNCTEMASAGHTYGKPVIGAESFTCGPNERWLRHPGNLKNGVDWALCEGINRVVFHRYAAQPWLNAAPGMMMGHWGLRYERTQTWWEQSKAWHDYLSRCQHLLRQGLYVADIAYLTPEGAPRAFPQKPPEGTMIGERIRSGYGWDACSTEVVLTRMKAKDGMLVLPDGMNYRALVLPESETMSPALFEKIKEFADAGVMIVGPASPPRKAPSLVNKGADDLKIEKEAAALWASGKILSGKTVQQFLSERGVPPDFTSTPILRHIHRRDGDRDLYFIANPETTAVDVVANFRVSGKQPELWWPDSGRTEPCVSFKESDGITTVHLRLEQSGSAFVVFRSPTASMDPVVALRRNGQPLWSIDQQGSEAVAANTSEGTDPVATLHGREANAATLLAWKAGRYELQLASEKTQKFEVPEVPEPQVITGPWKVRFDPKAGGPGDVTFAALDDWAKRPEEGIKYYSGTAIYTTTFTADPSPADSVCMLDLGSVEVMAEVTLNGKNLGTLWKAPYRVDVSKAIQPGTNELVVKVVNLWANRQIGDENLPADSDRNADGTLKSWPEWLLKNQPSPAGRISFASLRLWKKDEPLVPSGLIGPVRMMVAK
jgi:hypothetical protein